MNILRCFIKEIDIYIYNLLCPIIIFKILKRFIWFGWYKIFNDIFISISNFKMMIILFINFYLFHIQLLYKIHNIEINLLTI